MSKQLAIKPPKPTEDDYRARLGAGGFRLETGAGYGGYVVYNHNGDVVFGMRPRPYSASLEQVASFLEAQQL